MPQAPAPRLPFDFNEELPLLALHDAVVFPGTLIQILLRDASLAQHLSSNPQGSLAVFVGKESGGEPGEPMGNVSKSDLHDVGVVAQVVSVAKARDEAALVVVLRGVTRARLESVAVDGPIAKVRVSPVPESSASDEELDALFLNLRHAVHEVMDQLGLPAELGAQIDAIGSASELADFVSARLDVPVAERAEILGTLDVKARVHLVLTKVIRRREVLKIRKSIDSQIQNDLGKKQREHLLREQMKAIERELGEEDGDDESDVDGLAKRVAEAKLSDEAREVAEKQLKRLRALQSGSPEFGTVRTYLEWIVDLPWTVESQDSPDVAAVRAVLDADHYGLQKVKRRILEYLAVRKLKSDKKGPILCLIGPPGVGKTSLGRSIAGALGRKFHRVSLGGVHDEAAIRGHRRTYVGALPGTIISGMKKVGVTNPVPHARRGRQARPRRRAGRPVVRAARGARPRAERHVLRSLPGDPLRPLERDVHRDRQRRGHHPRAAARPDGGHRDPRVHPPREARDRAPAPRAQAAPRAWHRRRPSRDHRRGARAGHRAVHPRGGGPLPREADREDQHAVSAVRFAEEGNEEAVTVRDESDVRSFLGQARHETTSGSSARRKRAWRPGWPGRPSAGPSCSSRRRACRGAAS